MIYPHNFEQKIGFADLRTQLKGRCTSTLGAEWVDTQVRFSRRYAQVAEWLAQAADFARFVADGGEELYEPHFFDLRTALVRIRPDRTYLEEHDLFDLRRALQTVISLVAALRRGKDEADATAPPRDAEAPKTEGEDAEAEAESIKAASLRAAYPALFRLASPVACFPQVVRRIDLVLNPYGRIKDTATTELLNIRRTLDQTARSISHSLRSIIAEAKQEGYIDRDVAPTLRDGRLVIPVAPALKRKIRGIVHDESATGRTVFIEPAAVVEANNRVRELKAAERREMIRILQILSKELRPHIDQMLASLQFLAQIDYLRALTAFADQAGAIVPELHPTPRIEWQQARHPLLEQSLARQGKRIVPLDVSLRGGKRMLLISGPNAGGKSVCLKTVGLLQYMLQCGLPVPTGEGSVCGLFDDIFIDIGDEQSLENDLSTYSSHLLNMKTMLRHATAKSLLLIDEFGSGTEPQIGGALAEAILRRFVEQSPSGIITTHYQNLKHYAEGNSVVANGAMLYDRAQMQPLFVLQVGNPGSSFAIEIARKIGLPEAVIEQAAGRVGQDYVMSDKYLQDITRDKLYWEAKRRNIHEREKRLERTIARYEGELAELHEQRRQIMADARHEAQQLIESSRAEIERTIRTIKEQQAEREATKTAREHLQDFAEQALAAAAAQAKEDAISRKMDQIRRRQERNKDKRSKAAADSALGHLVGSLGAGLSLPATAAPAPAPAAAGKPTVGAWVRIKGQQSAGRLEAVQRKLARVRFGAMLVSVPLGKLEPCEAPKPEKRLSQVSTFVSRETREAVYEKKLRFRPDIDLRGMRAEEALTAVQYFIDDALLLEQRRVRILHGTGTGALRQAIREYLNTVAGVMAYRDEHVQFGGAGITVVELRG